ncbi:MAG: CDP-alcohol phosphatidyltransferase family protein [Aeriscardovia sp.]|nr:CDP-alcohol phosphatidyltransferase family protein [Aeriscardovia sp.]
MGAAVSTGARDSVHFGPPARRIIWTVPNVISFLRIVSIPFIAWLIATRRPVAALIVLAVSGASDGLDGYIARRFDQVSVLGQILDPIADRLLIICSALALAIARIVPWWLMIIICCRDLVMGIEILVLAQHDYGPLPVHFVGKVGTFMLMLAIPTLIVSHVVGCYTHTIRVDFLVHSFGLACCWWGVGLYWLAGIIYLAQGHLLLKKRP